MIFTTFLLTYAYNITEPCLCRQLQLQVGLLKWTKNVNSYQ